MKMIISAGGTGGHIYPALAIVKKFQKEEKDFEVLYIGTHNRMENDIVPKEKIPYKSLKIYGFSKSKIGQDICNVYYVIKAFNDAKKIMQEFKPDIVVGVGGYVTLPVIMAARSLKIKSVIHEQNSIPGKTNKFLSRGVSSVFTSFKISSNYFAKGIPIKYTGNPSGDNVVNLKPMKKESLGLSKDKKLVLITSGSLGSSGLNSKLIEFLKLSGNKDYEVVFITGKGNYEEIKNNDFASNIKVIPYLENLSSLFSSCDLVISRAGAGTISELLASKTPAILIPSPNVSNNHQYYNAKEIGEEKMALMIEENELDSKKLFDDVNDLLNNSPLYQELKDNLNKRKSVSSSDLIYKYIKEIVKND